MNIAVNPLRAARKQNNTSGKGIIDLSSGLKALVLSVLSWIQLNENGNTTILRPDGKNSDANGSKGTSQRALIW